jgi:TPP-dependent trihydroxycyclohexane-1,2-dione (THcHDO) dehydratase
MLVLNTVNERRGMDTHETAMGVLRDKLTEARRLYEEAIVAINTQRAAYAEVYEAWWEEMFPGGGGAALARLTTSPR